jgi:DNA-binding MarR family transcriptional regulator
VNPSNKNAVPLSRDQQTPAPQGPSPCGQNDPPLRHALLRILRATMFDRVPLPEMDALPLAQLRLLWAVFATPHATMKDYSERLGVSQSTVTQLADRLVRRGLLERHADATDRRVVRLQNSAEGTRVLNRDVADHQRVMQDIWEALSSQDQATVMQGLEILGKAADAVRVAQGRPLAPWPEKPPLSEEEMMTTEASQPQPVLDLMTRRVRGRNAASE